jgi:DNA-binding PadR family transcriptional regulator
VNHSKYLKGLLEPLILKLLQEEGRMYGYEITRKMKELTAGQVLITEGALYPLLHKLEAEGLVETESEMINNRIRKYYRLTAKGGKESGVAVEALQQFFQVLGLLVQPQKLHTP